MKGTLFVDYVRMLRTQKGRDWSKHLQPEDLSYLVQRIAPDDWYPMDTFERMGIAILETLAPSLETIRVWGRAQVEWLCQKHADLVAKGDAVDTLMRFRVLRASFFDYPALQIGEISDGEAKLLVSYGMSARAEEAATWQTLGFFERLVEVAGAHDVTAWLQVKSWEGSTTGGASTIRLQWKGAGHH